tara:strand:- start:2333 stop:2743 length:411 start_codon:yes stop_codon:yes gene_type:complete
MSSNREIPQRFIVADQVNGSDVDIVASDLEYFDSVTTEGTGTLQLYGGVFEYVAIDSQSDDNVVKYINPDTGEPFPGVTDGSPADLADGKDAGWYEKVATEPVSIAVPAGTPIYGRFTQITIPSGDDINSVVITNG